MAVDTKLELKENSKVSLKITVPEAEVKKTYDDLINEYCKKVQVKGFRKGKVPASVLIRKFGDALKDEAAQKVIENNLEKVFETVDKKPLPYAQPELDGEIDFDITKDFSFGILYDTYPEIELGEYKGLEVEVPSSKVGKEDLERELKALQEQNSVVVNKASALVAKDDIVTVDYLELDEKDEPIEGTKREGFTFTVGSGYNVFKLDDEITGMKLDEEKVIEKEFPADYEYKEHAGQKKRIKVKISAVKEKKLPELDDELAQDISDEYKTLADLKKDIESKLQLNIENKIKDITLTRSLEKIAEASKIDIPDSMLQRELSTRWQTILYRYQMNETLLLNQLEKEGKSKDMLMEEMKPEVIKAIKSSLVMEKIADLEKIEIKPEEIDEELKKIAENQKKDFDEIKDFYTKRGYTSSIEADLRNQKVFDLLSEKGKTKKGKSVKYLDLMQEKY
ncbi:MAG: trigger factor [Spirochaetales bacterium]|nr:trigger factor [Spirochaetales bacterium]